MIIIKEWGGSLHHVDAQGVEIVGRRFTHVVVSEHLRAQFTLVEQSHILQQDHLARGITWDATHLVEYFVPILLLCSLVHANFSVVVVVLEIVLIYPHI